MYGNRPDSSFFACFPVVCFYNENRWVSRSWVALLVGMEKHLMPSHSRLALMLSAGVLATAVSAQADSVAVFDGGLLLSNGVFFDGSATLNLGSHDLIVKANIYNRDAVLAWVTGFVAQGLNEGTGIVGSGLPYTNLAVMANNFGSSFPVFETFDGHNVDFNAILVKHTWTGDSNLDGVVNADDYFAIDSGFISQLPGYPNGDFNYDGVINADDYFLIDSAFMAQTGVLSDSDPILGIPTKSANSPVVPLPASVWGGLALLAGVAAGRVVRRD